eukprot:gene6922-8258_t
MGFEVVSLFNSPLFPELRYEDLNPEMINEYSFDLPDLESQDVTMAIGNTREDTASPLLLGHMLNDGAADVLIPHRDAKDAGTLLPAVMRYYEVAKEANNCDFVPFNDLYLVVVRTKRAIQRGEELKVTYQPGFWLRHLDEALEALSSTDKEYFQQYLSSELLNGEIKIGQQSTGYSTTVYNSSLTANAVMI